MKALSSSVNAVRGQFGQTNYAAAKAGILGFTKSLAQEVIRKGITVTAVDKKSFQDAILKNVSFESMGYTKADWELWTAAGTGDDGNLVGEFHDACSFS